MNKINWFELWHDDKESILNTMIRNMSADLDAGYDYFGNCIKLQRETIEKYKKDFDDQLMEFANMDDAKRNRWCYYDMLRRGVISR